MGQTRVTGWMLTDETATGPFLLRTELFWGILVSLNLNSLRLPGCTGTVLHDEHGCPC